MNARKAKALRKGAIENSPDNYKWVDYEMTNQQLKRYMLPDEDGIVRERQVLTYTLTMKPCVRKLYQQAKKAA